MTKVYLQSMGCSMNFSEGESMAGILDRAGYYLTDDPNEAECGIINICTIKGNSTALKAVRKLLEENSHLKLVITGCITREIMRMIRSLKEDTSFLSNHNLQHIASVVEETMNDNPIAQLAFEENIHLETPRVRKNKIIGILPISNGCSEKCSYCSIILTRGKLYSYPMDTIVEEAKKALSEGCKELWVTSQDNAMYGMDHGGKSQLPELMRKLVKIEGEHRIRIGMINPWYMKDIMHEMIEIYNHPNVFKFLHLPFQAGNDDVLKRMERNYTAKEYISMVERFKREVPGITIATDVIVGFPGETREQFVESLDIVSQTKPDVVNISRFIPRLGTKAYAMKDQVDGEEKRNRSRHMTQTFERVAFERNKTFKGQEMCILLDDTGKNGTMVGRTDGYKPVVVEGDWPLGTYLDVRIRSNSIHHLVAEPLRPQLSPEATVSAPQKNSPSE